MAEQTSFGQLKGFHQLNPVISVRLSGLSELYA
jgi:hypothetical protein